MIAALYISVEPIDAGIAILIISLYLAVLALSYYFQRHESLSLVQRICLSFVLVVLVVLVGLALSLSDQEFQNDLPRLLMSCLALFCAVIFTIISSDLTKVIGSGPTNFYTSLWELVCLFGLLLLPLELDLTFPTSFVDWSAIFCNGLFYVVGYFLFFEAARRIGVTRASLLTSVEPLFAALLAMALFSQTLTALEWAEFFIVLIGLFYFEKSQFKSNI